MTTATNPESDRADEAVTIELPDALRALAGNRAEVRVRAGTVAEALDELGRLHPEARLRILTRGGELRPHVNLFVGDADIRSGRGLATELQPGDSVLVVPSVAGG
ncbi:MAG: MoaD/ThiS family protein [Wenzhouxiangellaceae bacterium]|nr:MoaD/ThiS family protein [Wenzhouxiangellaceae bacterium]